MKKIKFYGIGGQGAVTAAKILSVAVSVHEDKYAITVPAYGHERRGAPVYAHIIMDDEPVQLNCYVYEPDMIAIYDEHLIDTVDIGEGCTPDTIVVLNTASQEMVARYREKYGFKTIYACDATDAAIRTIGLNIPNSAMLGAIAKSGIVSIESVEKAVVEGFGKNGLKNGGCARYAYEHTYEA